MENSGNASPQTAPTDEATVDQGFEQTNKGKLPGQTAKVQGGPQPGDVKAAAAEAMRKYKVKVDGKEMDVDEGELIRGYSHQKAASKAMNEGKALRKQAEEFVSMLKDKAKLKEVLQKLGHDPRKLSEEILAAHLEDELMDPKDRELRNLKSELSKREEKERQEHEAFKQRALQERTEQMRVKFEKEFVEALEASKLPKTKNTVGRMAAYVERGARLKVPVTAQEAAKLVEEDLRAEHLAIANDEPSVESLIKLYGEDFLNKVRKYDVSRLKNPEMELKTPSEPHKPRERNPQKRMSSREWQLHKRGLK